MANQTKSDFLFKQLSKSMSLRCEGLSIFVKDLPESRKFYLDLLGCIECRYIENTISTIWIGTFCLTLLESRIIDISPIKIHFELPTHQIIDELIAKLQLNNHKIIRDWRDQFTQTAGNAYGFVIYDPDGYELNFRSWEGLDDCLEDGLLL